MGPWYLKTWNIQKYSKLEKIANIFKRLLKFVILEFEKHSITSGNYAESLAFEAGETKEMTKFKILKKKLGKFYQKNC